MRIRRLEKGEREAWLDLLDGWELLDGWRGRDYFRRPIEDDPTYEDANVWVAEEAGRLVCSVQIFPRELIASGVRVPTGGIGTVYTRSDRRGAGLASALLERSVEDMRARGMEISLLFAARIPFYERLGWRSWPMRRDLLRPNASATPRPRAGDPARISHHPSTADAHPRTLARDFQARLLDVPRGTPPGGALRKESEYPKISRQSTNLRDSLCFRRAPATRRGEKSGLVIERFVPARDLEAVVALHAETAAGLAGAASRDDVAWWASLRLAGNPGEEFLVARAGRTRAPLAYARAIRLNEALTIAEHGLRDADALAALCEAILAPREPDPLAPAEKPSAEFRSFAVLSVAADPALIAALERRGVVCSSIEDPTPMLRCLDAQALARRLGLPPEQNPCGDALLRRVLPPGRFSYWLADRF